MAEPAYAPPKRMSAARIAVVFSVFAFLIGGAFGFFTSRAEDGSGLPPWVLPVGAAVMMAVGLAVTVVYWKRLDEAAREAHKWAWFWGGIGAYCLAVLVLTWLVTLPPDLDLPAFVGRTDPAALISLGASAVILGQTAAYLVAWCFWWLRNR